MKINYLSRYKNTGKGYTLLFAVLTAALVLGVAVFILSVSKKQYALSVAARDSMYSLYAADGGMECALAANTATGTPSQPASVTIRCNGADSNPPIPYVLLNSPDSQLWPSGVVYEAAGIIVALPDNTCAKVNIADGYYIDPSDSQTKHKTIIESRGYNFCDTLGPKASLRTVERALRLTYR